MIFIDDISLEEYKAVLSKLHTYILKIATEIKRLCDKHGLDYFLIGGSLLGAVRHKGFIPWDDDMDIGLLREDYERFLQVCKTELGDDFELITAESVENFGLPFCKIQLKGTALLEENAPHYNCGNGIFVDVFPIDKIPDSALGKKIHKTESAFFRIALLKKCGYSIENTTKPTLKRRIIYAYADIHSKQYLVKKMTRVATKHNRRNTKICYNTGTSYSYAKEVFPTELLSCDLQELPFEGVLFKCPQHPEIILEMLYGDYLSLPPEEKRYNRHGITAIDFGK